MNTEEATDYFLQHLLGSDQEGQIFVEVGLGSCDWSFQWAAKLGLRCVAVEPLPVPMLRAACQAEGVLLIEAAVGSTAGEAVMHHGELNGLGIPDTSSTRADWWAVGGKTTTVRMLSLQDVIHRAGEGAIACLKVDVEGAEAEVLSGLADLNKAILPKTVAFEYGGGGIRRTGMGGWTPGGIAATEKCLNLLRDQGYSWGVICERTLRKAEQFQTSEISKGLTHLLRDSFEVGNLILCRSSPPANMNALIYDFQRMNRWQGLLDRIADCKSHFQFQVRRYSAALLRRIRQIYQS